MSRYILSYIDSGTENLVPTPLGDFPFQAQATTEMHKTARAYLAEQLQQKYKDLLPSPLRLKFDLRKVPAIHYDKIVTKDKVKTLSSEALNHLQDVRVADEYAMLYMNDAQTWLDAVRITEQVPSWWQWGGRVVTFETLRSFAVQSTDPKSSGAQRHAPPGSDPKAYASWCQKRDQVMSDLNKKLAEQASKKRNELSSSVLRFEWDD